MAMIKPRSVMGAVFACFVLLTFELNSAQAKDECGAQLAEVIANAYPHAGKVSDTQLTADGMTLFLPGQHANGETERYNSICRIWPAHPDRLLVAVPLIADISASVVTGHLEILVMHASTLQAEQRLLLRNEIEDDAFKITSIAFDTARYRLKPTLLAFGLRVAKAGSSQVNPFSETALSLFVIEGDRVRRISDTVVVERKQGEWNGTCDGSFKTTTRLLAMGDNASQGLADIRITEAVSVTQYTANGRAECSEQTQDKPTRSFNLTFDGTRYVVPDELRPL
ncbi:hypothetical protein FVA81_02955 (plasmid) [Rhizobium sp. WL3]|uniref:hypothetical protein n=1 Tax=Rhizobium sp. WL3 TaxID=2603277 RepID=UPI0011C1F767|nr:hypothetical protein [Rhizobium sp. WL3]QEE43602.1 hypothetical protein FVA81_02955 [Rhizobium sp. WL3]